MTNRTLTATINAWPPLQSCPWSNSLPTIALRAAVYAADRGAAVFYLPV